jgi:hypothetical protein
VENNRIFRLALYAVCGVVLVLYAGHGLPVEAVPDETALLKNVYGMLQHRTPALVYPSVYSAWAHLAHLPFAALYWSGWLLLHWDAGLAGLTAEALNNYLAPVGFLRACGALVFLGALILATRVVDRAAGRAHGLLFFVFSGLNLVTVVLAHTVKQWLPGFSLFYAAVWLYWTHKEREAARTAGLVKDDWRAAVVGVVPRARVLAPRLVLAGAAAMAAALTVPPLLVFWVYFPLLHFRAVSGAALGALAGGGQGAAPGGPSSDWRTPAREAAGFCLGAAAALALTRWLGLGGNVATPTETMVFGLHPEFFAPYVETFLNMAPLAACGFFLSLPWAANRYASGRPGGVHPAAALALFLGLAGLLLILLLLPVIGNYYVVLFALFCAFPATLLPARLAVARPPLFAALVVGCVAFSLYVDAGWLRIMGREDTRQVATRELHAAARAEPDLFVLYNTVSSPYLPYGARSLRFLQERHPNLLGFREEAHLRWGLADGVNGIALNRILQSGLAPSAAVAELLDAGWRVLLVDEVFGRQMNMWHKDSWALDELREHFVLEPVAAISPYWDDADVDETRVGDVNMNFRDPYYAMAHVRQPGPRVSLYGVYKRP